VTCRETECEKGGCDGGETEIDSHTCFQGIIPYNEETCCTAAPAGCRWTGCMPGGCNKKHEIEVYKHDCKGLDALMNNELCCPAQRHQCRWTEYGAQCLSTEVQVDYGAGFLEPLFSTGEGHYCCEKQADVIGQYVAAAKSFGLSPTILDVPMIGTHHAPTAHGADHMVECLAPVYAEIAQTQEVTVRHQLEVGVRAMGFRPLCNEDQTRIQHYHGRCRYGDLSTHFTTINDFLVEHPTEVVVLLMQMFGDFTSETCNEMFREALEGSFSGVNFLTRADTESGWPTLESMVESNKRVMIVSDADGNENYFPNSIAHSWHKSNTNFLDGKDVFGQYFNTEDAEVVFSTIPDFLNEVEEVRQTADRHGRGQNLAHVHFYLTMGSDVDFNTVANLAQPPFVLSGPLYQEFYLFEEWMKITPVNVIWTDFYMHPAHDVGAMEMFQRQTTRRWVMESAAQYQVLNLMMDSYCLRHNHAFDPPLVKLQECQDTDEFKWRMYPNGMITTGTASDALCLDVPGGQGRRNLQLVACDTTQTSQFFAWNCSTATLQMELKMFTTSLQIGTYSVSDGSGVQAVYSTFTWTLANGNGTCPTSPEWILYPGSEYTYLDGCMGRRVPLALVAWSAWLLSRAWLGLL